MVFCQAHQNALVVVGPGTTDRKTTSLRVNNATSETDLLNG